VGQKWGKNSLPGFYKGKTLEGSIAGVFAAALVLLIISLSAGFGPSQNVLKTIAPAAVLLIEPFLPGQWDNPALLILSGLVLIVF